MHSDGALALLGALGPQSPHLDRQAAIGATTGRQGFLQLPGGAMATALASEEYRTDVAAVAARHRPAAGDRSVH